jgi:hypothetical protein
VQRKIIRRERGDVTGDWIKLHNTEFHGFYSSSNVIRMIKFRRMRCAGHAERSGGKEMHQIWWGNMKEGDHLEDLRVDGKIILKCIFRE